MSYSYAEEGLRYLRAGLAGLDFPAADGERTLLDVYGQQLDAIEAHIRNHKALARLDLVSGPLRPGVPQFADGPTEIPLDPPLHLDKGDMLLIRGDGRMLTRYNSEGDRIESRTWYEGGVR